MEEHLTAEQIAEFILGRLHDDELKAVYRHFDECVDCVEWLAGVIRAEAYGDRYGRVCSSVRRREPRCPERWVASPARIEIPIGETKSQRSLEMGINGYALVSTKLKRLSQPASAFSPLN